MRPAGQIWRPTAAQIFFEGEEEYRSWPKAPRSWSPRSKGLNARAALKVRLNRHYCSESPLANPSAGGICFLNELGRNELSAMPRNKPIIGPMRTQPIARASIMATPMTPMVRRVTKAQQPKQEPTKTQAIRAEKARITRLSSLRKQREALKA
jgi:hypothetical protein